ncbi:MAG: PA domain-containing protein [Burkholderiales bacterium]
MIAERFLKGCRAALAGATVVLAAASAQAATIIIVNADDPGFGFNDSTPATPVGGNTGLTVGEQRMQVFQFVASYWGKRLKSDVPIQIVSFFPDLFCTSTQAVLGAAGAYNIFSDFPNAKRSNTWYPSALANKLAGVALESNPDPFVSADIIAYFNPNLGTPDCLARATFYLGLDGKAAPDQIDFLTTVLHEVGHGLGFQTFTDGETGQQYPTSDDDLVGIPTIWDHLILDPQQRKTWDQMTNDERAASALVSRNLVWNGKNVTRDAPRVLDRGTPELFVVGAGLAKFFQIGVAQFGPVFDKKTFVSSELVRWVDQTGGLNQACTALDAAGAKAIRGKVAVIDRGTCAFTIKVANAELAGARAVIIADNALGTPPPALAGVDTTITIPAVRVSLDDGVEIKAAIASVKKPRFAPFGVLYENPLKLAGADYLNRVYLFSPNPYQGGSSISHYDTSATPNLLMEPFAEPNQAIAVSAPGDLTLELLQDIGW